MLSNKLHLNDAEREACCQSGSGTRAGHSRAARPRWRRCWAPRTARCPPRTPPPPCPTPRAATPPGHAGSVTPSPPCDLGHKQREVIALVHKQREPGSNCACSSYLTASCIEARAVYWWSLFPSKLLNCLLHYLPVSPLGQPDV